MALAAELDRVAVGGIRDRAEQRAPGGAVDCDQRVHPGGAHGRAQGLGVLARGIEVVEQHGHPPANPERVQPPSQLLGAEPAAERLGEDVPGEPPFRLPNRPVAHQLERDDHRRLPGDQPLEVPDAPCAPRGDEPVPPRACAAHRDRNRDGAAGERAALGDEHRLSAGTRPLLDLGPDARHGRLREPPLVGMASDLGATAVEQERRPADRLGDRLHDRLEAALGEDQTLEQCVQLDPALQH
ncbi:MAG: hypothetical protein U0R24_10910 [Solirubrobacterales bacterium]